MYEIQVGHHSRVVGLKKTHGIIYYLLTKFLTMEADLMITRTVLTRNYARCYEGSKDKSDRRLCDYKTQNPSRTADMYLIKQSKA